MADRKSAAIDAAMDCFLTMGDLRMVAIDLVSNPSLETVPFSHDRWRLEEFAKCLLAIHREQEREIRLIAEGRFNDI